MNAMNSPLAETPKLSRLFRMQWEEAQNAYVLLYPEGMVKLNQSAAEILTRCNGVTDVAAIIAQLEATFAQTELTGDVLAFVVDARERGWLV
jgi:pyrroloquinoline quinone biosynthesis protein D